MQAVTPMAEPLVLVEIQALDITSFFPVKFAVSGRAMVDSVTRCRKRECGLMASVTLAEGRIRALWPCRFAHDVRDGKLNGLCVYVPPPGGKRFFRLCQHDGERVWRMVDDADDISVSEARTRATANFAAIRQDSPVPAPPEDTVCEAFAQTVFRRHERIWKSHALPVNRSCLRRLTLPRIAGPRLRKSHGPKVGEN